MPKDMPRMNALGCTSTMKKCVRGLIVMLAPALLLDAHAASRGAPGDVVVRMFQLRNSASQSVEYSIANTGPTSVRVTCALEALYDEGWRELSGDVQLPQVSKMQSHREVGPATTIRVTFSPTKALRPSLIAQFEGGPFRLRCTYTSEGLDPRVPRKVTWSDEFLIVP